jgi:ABC-type maltose transport system permease subunit
VRCSQLPRRNEYLYATTFLRLTGDRTPVGLGQLIVGDVQPWGWFTAASCRHRAAVIIIYMLGQRFMAIGG